VIGDEPYKAQWPANLMERLPEHRPISSNAELDIQLRLRVGYMSQAFSLYTELTVGQNLELHARLYRLPPEKIQPRVAEVAERFELTAVVDALPDGLPMGIRQRLQLAVAMIRPAAENR